MGDWLLRNNPYSAVGIERIQVSNSATANTKGSWTELTSGFDVDINGILLSVMLYSYGDFLLDIGVGGSGSEVVILSNFMITHQGGNRQVSYVHIPLAVPASTRIAARTQRSDSGAVNTGIALHGFPINQLQTYGNILTIGANTSDSGGVQIDPGGTADTKGSWVEITSAAEHAARSFIICFGRGGNTAYSDYNWYFDVGIGAAASEQIIVPDLRIQAEASLDAIYPKFISIPVSIAQGQRIAVRSECSGTDTTDRKLDVTMYLAY